MIVYRLYTEDKLDYIETAKGIVSDYFDGYTLYPVEGMYKGIAESSFVIEIVCGDDIQNKAYVQSIAHLIKEKNNQESVLITAQVLDTCEFI